jgi:ABC-type taurine transport system substrate-binding protein
LSKDGFLAKKNELTKEADLLTDQMQQTRDSYERYLEEKAAEESRQAEIEKYAGHAGMSEEEMIALMYRGIERVLVFHDKHIEIVWKFQNLLEPYRQVNLV